MNEQGLSFTVIDAPHPMHDPDAHSTYDPRAQFYVAHRVWLGWNSGTDWLHDEIEREFGEDAGWYTVESKRDATHVGAAGEVAAVVLILMGAGIADFLRKYYAGFAQRLGETSADALLEWVRERSVERRKAKGIESTDGPPNLFEFDTDVLADGMRGELADVLRIAESRLELVRVERRAEVALEAVYRDVKTRNEYEVVAHRDAASFKRVGVSQPTAAEGRWHRGFSIPPEP